MQRGRHAERGHQRKGKGGDQGRNNKFRPSGDSWNGNKHGNGSEDCIDVTDIDSIGYASDYYTQLF